MLRALHFFAFLFFLTLVSLFIVLMRFFIWNNDLRPDFGRDASSLRKGEPSDIQNGRGEQTTFSLPMDYISELRIDLVGEGLIVQQVEGLSEITAEVFYPEAVLGETYNKVDYQLMSIGDRASFSTDKQIWQSWETQAQGKHKLLVGYVLLKVPADLQVLKVSIISGESEISGNFRELSFVSSSGDLYFKGIIGKAKLETSYASFFLKGQGKEDFDFSNINFRTINGKLIGSGSVENLYISAGSGTVNWQGSWQSFSGQFLILRMHLVLDRIIRGDWKVYAFSGNMDIELPKGAKRRSLYGFWHRRDVIDESLQIIVKSFIVGSFAVGLNYLI